MMHEHHIAKLSLSPSSNHTKTTTTNGEVQNRQNISHMNFLKGSMPSWYVNVGLIKTKDLPPPLPKQIREPKIFIKSHKKKIKPKKFWQKISRIFSCSNFSFWPSYFFLQIFGPKLSMIFWTKLLPHLNFHRPNFFVTAIFRTKIFRDQKPPLQNVPT